MPQTPLTFSSVNTLEQFIFVQVKHGKKVSKKLLSHGRMGLLFSKLVKAILRLTVIAVCPWQCRMAGLDAAPGGTSFRAHCISLDKIKRETI
jgi:hypothetical protein